MTERLFLLAYSLVTLSFSLFIGPLFLLHSRGRRRLLERYGVWEELQPGEYIWLHAASLGEAQAMLPLVHRVRLRFPDKRILFTAVSVTGLEAVQEKVDEVRLLPFDHQAWFPKQCREHQFLFFGFGETEIWPSVIRTLAKRGIPIFMINGTVSQKTSSWYSLIRPIVRPVLRSVKHLFLVNSESRSALVSLGAPEDRVAVVGNTKYDRAPRYPDLESVAKARSQFFQRENPVFLLASIHPGEGEPWLDTLPAFLKAGWNVVVAPRHQERFSYFGSSCVLGIFRSSAGLLNLLRAVNVLCSSLIPSVNWKPYILFRRRAFSEGLLSTLEGTIRWSPQCMGAFRLLAPTFIRLKQSFSS